MSKSALFWNVYQRLADDAEVDGLTQRLVEASFRGAGAVRAALESPSEGLGAESSVAEHEQPKSPEVYLDKLEVTGFRGIGQTTTVSFETAPGLTVVVGRNGSGKSSIAEALEVVLTGQSLRWKDRKQKDWLSGWKNLHHSGRTWIRAGLLVAGEGTSMQVQRSWATESYDDGALELNGERVKRLAWEEALDTFRPVLSYNEIGSALDGGPSHLYDLLRGVLGMEELTRAVDELATVRKVLSEMAKTRKARLASLQSTLSKSDDERTAKVEAAIAGRKPDVDALLELLVEEETGDAEVQGLRRAASLQAPSSEDVLAAAAALRNAQDEVTAASQMLAEMEAETVQVLRLGLKFHAHEPDADCPLCATPAALTADWRAKAEAHISSVEGATQARTAAKQAMESAQREARQVLGRAAAPPAVSLASVDAAREAHATWSKAPSAPGELAEHLEQHLDAVEASYAAVRDEAAAALSTLQAEWRPIRRSIEAFLEAFEADHAAKPQIKAIKEAETWLKDADGNLRNERFAPIRQQAQQIWEKLRHQSNVSLSDIRLEGTKTKRRVELDVAVDGQSAVALGVMSQGELHAMLLSLFLPRLTLPESPFRFLVVDDPVQAMDPAKVDGLAQVLSDVAADRQVVVFTHDARLPEALRRMQLPARIVEVTRAENSAVTLRDTRSRPAQFLADAWQVADDRSEYGPRVATGVVPGLCRGAVEAHLQAVAWDKLLREGLTHREVEQAVFDSKSVHHLAALAFFGDAGKGTEVYAYLNNKVKGGTETFKLLKDGSHGGFQGDVLALIQDTKSLLRGLGASV